jgi:hypothetical protein
MTRFYSYPEFSLVPKFLDWSIPGTLTLKLVAISLSSYFSITLIYSKIAVTSILDWSVDIS